MGSLLVGFAMLMHPNGNKTWICNFIVPSGKYDLFHQNFRLYKNTPFHFMLFSIYWKFYLCKSSQRIYIGIWPPGQIQRWHSSLCEKSPVQKGVSFGGSLSGARSISIGTGWVISLLGEFRRIIRATSSFWNVVQWKSRWSGRIYIVLKILINV